MGTIFEHGLDIRMAAHHCQPHKGHCQGSSEEPYGFKERTLEIVADKAVGGKGGEGVKIYPLKTGKNLICKFLKKGVVFLILWSDN